uniref:IS200/IS605 family accessory protein TnpB-related protein n=1 Tax=Aquibacillus sediminis TaxID=2574734 RepID=UPI001108FB87
AVSLVSKQGNFLESKVFYCHELEYVRSNKRNNIVGETVKNVFTWLLTKNVGAIVIENIKLNQQHDTNRKFNRLVNSFKKKKLTESIIRRGLRNGFQIKKINPAYTSVIGRFKYSTTYGLSVHEAASFVIARRGLGYEEKMPKALIQALRNKVKPQLIAKLGSMEETEKQSTQGKKQRQYLGLLLRNINNFKDIHSWSFWNVVH